MSDKFDEFVKKQIESSEADSGGLSLEREKAIWLEKLEQLYSLVRQSLSKYLGDGSIRLEFSDITLQEEQLGSYTVKEAHVAMGRQVVKLTPLGTFLLGARGRVDMTGPRGIARFVVVPPGARAPQVIITAAVLGATAPPAPPIKSKTAAPETWVWKIATQPPRVTYVELTEESFREALMKVVNG
jgi:hypothetical protein